jgi:hypothetical protein
MNKRSFDIPEDSIQLTPELIASGTVGDVGLPKDLLAVLRMDTLPVPQAWLVVRPHHQDSTMRVVTMLLPDKGRALQWRGEAMSCGDLDPGAPVGISLDEFGPEGEFLGLTFDGEVVSLE